MPAIRARKSSVSAQVTIYEAAASVPPEHRRRTRSQTATPKKSTPLFDAPSDSEDDEADFDPPKPIVKAEEADIKPKKRSPSKKPSLLVAHAAPPRWEQQYDIIRDQRKRIVAPVDMMGCEQGGRDGNEPVVEISWKVSLALLSPCPSHSVREVHDLLGPVWTE